MKLFYEYMVIFFNLSHTSSHLHPLQVENCDSNSQLVVDEGDNGKFRTERVKGLVIVAIMHCVARQIDLFLVTCTSTTWIESQQPLIFLDPSPAFFIRITPANP